MCECRTFSNKNKEYSYKNRLFFKFLSYRKIASLCEMAKRGEAFSGGNDVVIREECVWLTVGCATALPPVRVARGVVGNILFLRSE